MLTVQTQYTSFGSYRLYIRVRYELILSPIGYTMSIRHVTMDIIYIVGVWRTTVMFFLLSFCWLWFFDYFSKARTTQSFSKDCIETLIHQHIDKQAFKLKRYCMECTRNNLHLDLFNKQMSSFLLSNNVLNTFDALNKVTYSNTIVSTYQFMMKISWWVMIILLITQYEIWIKLTFKKLIHS